MHSYKWASGAPKIHPWPDLEEEGYEVLAGTPKQFGRIDWGSEEGPMAVGVWECTPGKVRLINPFSEFSTFKRGRVIITDSMGLETTFGPGDSLFIAQGETSEWEVVETLQKTFFLHISDD
jgi:uncharacterized cupin superfamily protein